MKESKNIKGGIKNPPETEPPMKVGRMIKPRSPKPDLYHETSYVLHKTAGLLNFLGGSFTVEDFEERSFTEIVDTILRNGGKVNVDVNRNIPKDDWEL